MAPKLLNEGYKPSIIKPPPLTPGMGYRPLKAGGTPPPPPPGTDSSVVKPKGE